ncbi:hypothetical protein PBY51_016909 [Eleginops maclovinus]|uniref:Uncharacterized protein n=1 Tax=Eleginops maclovinus TaxID=56733 RepID=A0AAN7WSH1_ELEMC|nr:hypothetical protein PBY51_016909 [Eleginops maclovinus]
MIEGNYGDTSPNTKLYFLILSSCFLPLYHHPLPVQHGGGSEDALGVWTVESWGETEGRVVAILAGDTEALFFRLLPVVLRPSYRLKLSSGYRSGSLADLLQRF